MGFAAAFASAAARSAGELLISPEISRSGGIMKVPHDVQGNHLGDGASSFGAQGARNDVRFIVESRMDRGNANWN